MQITSIEIVGLFEKLSVTIPLEERCLILVGPNGTGKSTIINIVYALLSAQWKRLSEYKFSRVKITFSDNSSVEVTSDDVAALSETSPTRRNVQVYYDRLEQANLLDDFLKTTSRSKTLTTQLASALRLPIGELNSFRNYFVHNIAGTETIKRLATIEDEIKQRVSGQLLYLPTYRRIERELKIILPDWEERRRHSAPSTDDSEGEKAYLEYIGFGMSDVQQLIDKKSLELKELAREQLSNLSVSLLKELLSTKEFRSSAQDRALTTDSVMRMLENFKAHALTTTEVRELDKSISLIREGRRGRPGRQELKREFLSSFLYYLSRISRQINESERDLMSLASRLDSYLQPQKRAIYDQLNFSIYINDSYDRRLQLANLSSGEKQIVALFALLNLGEHKDYVMIVDEPELSLSVQWQKRLLPDVLLAKRCSFVLAATHSPAIFDNDLDRYAVDVRSLYTP